MKTQATKLSLKKQTIIDLDNKQLYLIRSGWDTKTETNAVISRTTSSAVCATSFTTITTGNNSI